MAAARALTGAGRTFARHVSLGAPAARVARSQLLRSQPRAMVATTAPAETSAPKVIYRKDYQATPYLIDTVDLNFDLNEDVTTVTAKLAMTPNYGTAAAPPPLVLHGRKDLKLVSVKAGGAAVSASGYEVTDKTLTLLAPPAGAYELEIVTAIKPQDNSDLEGLYKSSGNYCTQCEAEGFRGITYFLDRPDVMAKYTTRIEADSKSYPVLLGNGNLIQKGDAANGRHFAVWEDPFPKPCYLFALVAGDLQVKEDSFTTKSGNKVALRIYTQPQYIDQVDFAMVSLKKSMKWDEEVFGLEYDLDLFNIVAVDDFNMGAMENKSLNIFNSRLVLATPESSSDGDYARIEGVVAHEYFHNWTGNRVTCRDWFQLTLKEGLTVYRDQEFSSDMNSRAVKRIEDAMRLRAAQFSEDAGPMAHPIRPDSYIKMDNFYTVTVYEKGAEIIRLYATLLGKEGFRKGMDLYFKRHDGQAVTCDDFLAAMADANGVDLSGIGKWYSQAGTPQLTVSTSYDAAKQTFTINTRQRVPPTPGQPEKQPVMIPVKVGLLGPDGNDLPLRMQGSSEDLGTETVLRCDAETNTFVFTGVTARPVPSLLRDFSAPVKMTVEGQSDEDLVFMFANDSDPFNRWDAGQRLAMKLVLSLYEAAAKANADGASEESVAAACSGAGGVSPALVDAFRAVLTADDLDGSFKAMAVTLPSTSEIVDAIPQADPLLVYQVRSYINKQIAARLRPELEALVAANDSAPGEPFVFNADAAARRAIKNKALGALSFLGDKDIEEQLLRRFREATNMTDRINALACLAETPGAARDAALSEYYAANKDKPLNMLKWLAVQAGSGAPGNLAAVRELLSHPAFALTNPNSCYSLFLGFARSAPNFHAKDGSGYEFLADAVIKLNKVNAIVASRVASAFTTYRQYDGPRQELMRAQLQRIAALEGLNENVYEIVSKSLEQ